MKQMSLIILQLIIAGIVLAQRNTILIIADDLSPDYLGVYNESADTANTPNIRKLAKNGVVFTRAWGSPLCTVTRAEVLTGKFPFRTGLGAVITGTASAQIDTSEMTVAKLLKQYAPQKYNTACIGKWHLNISTPNKYVYPNKCGFDLYSGNFNGAITDYYNYQIITNSVTHTVTTYATTKTVNDAIDWLDTLSNNRPFFLWLAFNAPHTPLHLPPAGLTTISGLTGTTADINNNPKAYFKAALEALDTELGRLITHLQTIGKYSNTDFVFMGDNGNDIRVSQNPDKYKSKNTLYDYGVRVPMIISGSSVVNPGRECSELVSVADLFVTIPEMNNVSNWLNYVPLNKRPIDGWSLLSVIKNTGSYSRNWIFTQKFTTPADTNDGRTIRNTNYHLMRLDDGSEEFYNQTTDPFETVNLLNGQMTSTDISNYHQLCDTLYALTGGSACLNISVRENSLEQDLKLSPNPTTDFVAIKSAFDVKRIIVYDITGKVLKTVEYPVFVDLSELQTGLYIFNIQTKENSRLFRKVVKE